MKFWQKVDIYFIKIKKKIEREVKLGVRKVGGTRVDYGGAQRPTHLNAENARRDDVVLCCVISSSFQVPK